MKRAAVPSILVPVVLLAVGVIAEAQQPTKVPRIGFLGAASASALTGQLDAFRQGLRELGYIEGKNILVNLNYFSFTTLLTIGFGDIAPLSLIAKRAVMFIGLLGHFYTVFVTGIIIGKYLTANRS